MQIALYQPDIPQNLGAILRLSACMQIKVHVIEPCGFILSDAKLKRAGMDYIERAQWQRHASWQHFLDYKNGHGYRLLLAETDGTTSLYETIFSSNDIIVFGSESHGTPREHYALMDAVITIPMQSEARSLNLAMSAAICVGEAYRQLRWSLGNS